MPPRRKKKKLKTKKTVNDDITDNLLKALGFTSLPSLPDVGDSKMTYKQMKLHIQKVSICIQKPYEHAGGPKAGTCSHHCLKVECLDKNCKFLLHMQQHYPDLSTTEPVIVHAPNSHDCNLVFSEAPLTKKTIACDMAVLDLLMKHQLSTSSDSNMKDLLNEFEGLYGFQPGPQYSRCILLNDDFPSFCSNKPKLLFLI